MPAKRFYKMASVTETGNGFAVTLDGRPIKTPGGHALATPFKAMAEALAAEWEAQDKEIRPETMPLTRYANTAIDRVPGERASVEEGVAAYAQSDLLCHLAPAPEALTLGQQAAWQPWLAWAEKRFGARLAVTMGLMPQQQAPEALAALSAAVAGTSDWQLTALADAVALTGSLILGLAVLEDALSPEEAWELSQLDEEHQVRQWGEDAEAEAVRQAKRQSLLEAAAFLKLSGSAD